MIKKLYDKCIEFAGYKFANQILAKKLKPKGIEIRPESYKWSVIQALLSRSDRRLAPVIAIIRGSQNSLGGWKKAYEQIREKDCPKEFLEAIPLEKLPPWEEVIHQNWDLSRILPWTHLEGPLKSEILIQHQREALNEDGHLK